MYRVIFAAFFAVLFNNAAHAYSVTEIDVPDSKEKVVIAIPDDWEKAYQHDDGKGSVIREYVPKGQTVDNWDEMITVTTFRTDEKIVKGFHQTFAKITLSTFLERICKTLKGKLVLSSVSNNTYDASLLRVACLVKPGIKGKVSDIYVRNFEMLWAIVIQGTDGIYIVQRAWHTDDEAAITKDHETALDKEKELYRFAMTGAVVCQEGSETKKCATPSLLQGSPN